MEHSLWMDLGGRVCCPAHIGASAGAVLSTRPRSRVLRTGLTVWERMTDDDRAEWAEFLFAENGSTVLCESCRYSGGAL